MTTETSIARPRLAALNRRQMVLRTVAYIHAQAEHHKRVSFSDEFRKFRETHGMREE